MPQALKDKLMIPVEVPAWGVITFFVSGAFAFGILYNELKTVVKGQEKVDLIYERQIRNIEAVNTVREQMRVQDTRLNDHDVRLLSLERGK